MRTHLRFLLAAGGLLLASCAPAPVVDTPTAAAPARPTRTPPPTATPPVTPTTEQGQPPEGDAPSLPTDRNAFFLASGACAVCHQGLSDESGADVSLGSAWRSSMMANSARDPY